MILVLERWLKICTSYMVYSQIWLNVPMGSMPLFLHLPMNDSHFGYKQKFLIKKIWKDSAIPIDSPIYFWQSLPKSLTQKRWVHVSPFNGSCLLLSSQYFKQWLNVCAHKKVTNLMRKNNIDFFIISNVDYSIPFSLHENAIGGNF